MKTADGVRTRRTRVKICGIRCAEDARLAIDLGADALGFNTWPGSKRFLELAREESWLRTLPPFISRVALLVNAPLQQALAVAGLPYIDALQLHGDEDAAYVTALLKSGKQVIKALRVRAVEDLDTATTFPTPHFLIDAHVAGLYGGTGVAADWGLASEFRQRFPEKTLILAGGLRPDNVAAAVAAVEPYAVDVSSGVEGENGRKDPELVRRFIEEVGKMYRSSHPHC